MNVNRKCTYKIYPNAMQNEAMLDYKALHCRVYNTLLEQAKYVYEDSKKSYTFASMCRDITTWRKNVPTLQKLNAQSLQVTAKRLSNAFNAFFKRSKEGTNPGYPRFKTFHRYTGWGYKTHGDGWKFHKGTKANHRLYLAGIGTLQIRGKARFTGRPKTMEVFHKNNNWFASITFEVDFNDIQRTTGTTVCAFDWGIKDLLTLVKLDGSVETIKNPKWLSTKLNSLKAIQRAISKTVDGTKKKRLEQQFRAIHGKIARQRHDFYHKLSALLVSQFGGILTEKLNIPKMVKRPNAIPDGNGGYACNGAGLKAPLHRAVLDAAPIKLLDLISIKAEEAGCWFEQLDTLEVKPTQRCCICGSLVPKELHEREHRCLCGCKTGRDINSGFTILRWFYNNDVKTWAGTAPPWLTTAETPTHTA